LGGLADEGGYSKWRGGIFSWVVLHAAA